MNCQLMAISKKSHSPPSRLFGFVRGRQLEGTFPGDRGTGVWPITAWRIRWGWGDPPEKAWPYEPSIWPPAEPIGNYSPVLGSLEVGIMRQRDAFPTDGAGN